MEINFKRGVLFAVAIAAVTVYTFGKVLDAVINAQ